MASDQPEHSRHDIFCLRQLQNKSALSRTDHCTWCLSTSPRYDTIRMTVLWHLLGKYECPEKFTTMIETLYTGMMANVSAAEWEVSETLDVTNCVK